MTCHWLLVLDSAAVASLTSSPLTLATSSRYFSPVVVLHETICAFRLSRWAESVYPTWFFQVVLSIPGLQVSLLNSASTAGLIFLSLLLVSPYTVLLGDALALAAGTILAEVFAVPLALGDGEGLA